jgi:hypothetical protein
MGNNINYK